MRSFLLYYVKFLAFACNAHLEKKKKSNVVQPMYLWNLKFILHTTFVMMERKQSKPSNINNMHFATISTE